MALGVSYLEAADHGQYSLALSRVHDVRGMTVAVACRVDAHGAFELCAALPDISVIAIQIHISSTAAAAGVAH